MTETIFKLKIENSGAADRILHESFHVSMRSGYIKAQYVLKYDFPELDKWYDLKIDNEGKGYVLSRDEINGWPIRIHISEIDILSLNE